MLPILAVALAVQQVHTSLMSNYDQSQILVMWVSPSTSGTVHYGVESDHLNQTAQGTYTTYSVASNNPPNYVSPNIFSAILSEGVAPGHTYYYVINDGQASEQFSVSIPSSGQQTLTIAFTGDIGTDENSSMTMKTLMSFDADIVAHAGDLSYANNYNNQSIWDAYANMLQPLASSVLYVPTAGSFFSFFVFRFSFFVFRFSFFVFRFSFFVFRFSFAN
jgi:hypothetical protein